MEYRYPIVTIFHLEEMTTYFKFLLKLKFSSIDIVKLIEHCNNNGKQLELRHVACVNTTA